MKYYKDENNLVYAFEADGSQDDFIGKHLLAISKEEADKLRFPLPTLEQTQDKLNTEARAYLLNTDWYVVRFAETGVAIPTEIIEARKLAREAVV